MIGLDWCSAYDNQIHSDDTSSDGNVASWCVGGEYGMISVKTLRSVSSGIVNRKMQAI